MNRFVPFLLLLLFGTIWGGTIPFTKLAVETGHHPLGLIFWQMIIAIVLLSPVALVRRSRVIFDRRHIRYYAVIAMIGTVIPNTFSYWASFHLPGGVMALVIATVPIFTLLIALGIGSERLEVKRALGVLLGIGAVAMLILPQSALPDPSKILFVFIALIAPLTYGMEGNYLASAEPPRTGPVATLLGASIVGLVIATPPAVFSGGFVDPTEGIGKAEIALFIAISLHVIAYVGFIWLVSLSGAVFSSQIAYIVTPAGVVLSAIILGEDHSVWLWLSLTLMLFAILLVRPREKATALPQPAARAPT